MSRNVESIRKAFSRVQGTQSTSETLNFAPGHFVGFFLSISGGQIVVSEGEANVAGHSVRLAHSATVEENAWAVERSAQHMYYVYLKRDGNFWVDTNDPTWMSMYNGFYHPILAYRYLGKVFVDSTGKIIYKLSAHYDQQSAIVVGAKGYTGYMDYECDGVADQDEINLALKFANEWGGYGGEVRLSRGGFFTTAAIEMLSNTTLEGDGVGATVITKNCNDYAVKAIGTAAIYLSNIGLRHITVTRDSADTNDNRLMDFEYVYDLVVSLCEIKNQYYTGIYATYCPNITVSQNVFHHTTGTYGSDVSCINVYYSAGAVVIDNVIYDINAYRQAIGIRLIDCDDGIVERNRVGPISGEQQPEIANRQVFGIGVGGGSGTITNARVSGNRVKDVCSYGLVASAIGYKIESDSINCVLSGNTGFDNGSLIENGSGYSSSSNPKLVDEANGNEVNCTFVRSSATTMYAGRYSYLFTKSAATGTQARCYFHSGTATAGNMCGLVAGTEHKFTGWFKVPTGVGTASAFYIGMSDNSGAGWASTTAALSETYDAWQGVSCTRTLTATATSVAVFMGATASATLNALVYTDQWRLAPIGVHNEYGQNFSDAGTGTRTSGNSWQSPFEE